MMNEASGDREVRKMDALCIVLTRYLEQKSERLLYSSNLCIIISWLLGSTLVNTIQAFTQTNKPITIITMTCTGTSEPFYPYHPAQLCFLKSLPRSPPEPYIWETPGLAVR